MALLQPHVQPTELVAAEVSEAVARARAAAPAWAATPLEARVSRVLRLRDALARRADEAALALGADTGKLRHEALGAEIVPACAALTRAANRAPHWLRERRRGAALLARRRVRFVRVPFGVIGIAAPWNEPVLAGLRALGQALLAGNAGVLVVPDTAPRVARLLDELAQEAALPRGTARVLGGAAAARFALVAAGCDKLLFSGSRAESLRVAAACGERALPLSIEVVGKAPMLVGEGVDLARAARAAVWGAFAQSGQARGAIGCVYVTRGAAHEFTQRVLELTRRLRQGPESEGEVDVGALAGEGQLEALERQIGDALAKGARLLSGGRRNPRWEGSYFEPSVLTDVHEKMELLREPAFGPVLAIRPVDGEEEALRLAAELSWDGPASILTRERGSGRALARGLRLPSAALGDAGCGGSAARVLLARASGSSDLEGFCRVVSIAEPGRRSLRASERFPADARRMRQLQRALGLMCRAPFDKLVR